MAANKDEIIANLKLRLKVAEEKNQQQKIRIAALQTEIWQLRPIKHKFELWLKATQRILGDPNAEGK